MSLIFYLLASVLGIWAGHDIAVNRSPLVIVMDDQGHIIKESRVHPPIIVLQKDGLIEVRHARGREFKK